MRLSTMITAAFLGTASLVQAQTLDPTYIQAIITALTGANLTALANAAQAAANSTNGAAFLAQLQGSNKTLLAPSNEAFAAVPADVASNTTLLADILSYHVLNASLTSGLIASAPNHTIARSLYQGGYPANRTTPVVLFKSNTTTGNSSVVIQQATGLVNATAGPVAAANFEIYVIDQVLALPPDLTTAATALLPSLAGVIQQAGLLDALNAAPALTVFAPADAAIAAAASVLGTLNSTQIQDVLANHVINGSIVFSTQLTSSNYTSAGGSPFTFSTNSTGTYVTSGTATARIISSDLVINNGVVHVIDQVLANPASDPGAAASAASSYSAAATATSNGAGVIGVATTTDSSGNPTTAAATTSAATGAAVGSKLGSIVPILALIGGVTFGVALL